MAEQEQKYSDYRSEIEQWANMWDEVQEKEDKTPSDPSEPRDRGNGFGSTQTLGLGYNPSPDDPQDLYYSWAENELLSEQRKTPNPVYPDSVGPDHETTPPVWVSEDIVKEITALKDKLFDVENKLAKMGGDTKWSEKAQLAPDDKLLGEIKSLKEKIEKLSSVLGTEHEPSPWVVHKD